ncbi:phosphatidylinositol phosphate synthase [Williamsia sp. MIQD14]|uniref:phosphatidylinositol phosphate synthase n=1 Tax=Williamsia sp. MIQD14 TaxID=3425703 RepID=UPI003DA036F3
MARFLSITGRAGMSKITVPIARVLLKAGLTPDSMTVIGTVASVAAAVTLFPMGHLLAGALVIWLFVMFDMIDGAMARERGGGTRFGAVLDATCDRIADGAIFAALGWWCLQTEDHPTLFVGMMICLVTSQVISYAKARAEASGLDGNGGLIERPERLIIILVGAGFSELGMPWLIHVAVWLLAVGSVITVGQRMLSISNSPGARDLLPIGRPADTGTGSEQSTPESPA